MRKKLFGFYLLTFGFLLILLSFSVSLTGNLILENPFIKFNPFLLIGTTFILFSVFFLLSRQPLDVIIIPTGGGEWDPNDKIYSVDKERAQTGLKHKNDLKENKYFLISGYMGRGPKEVGEGQSYSIYKFLRKNGVKPSQMIIEGKSHDSLENVLYSLKKVKEKEEKLGVKKPWNVAFVSYPDHLKRFEDFEKAAIKKGFFDKKSFKFYNIPTEENSLERSYENSFARKILHRYKISSMDRYKSKDGRVKYVNKTDPVLSFIKKLEEFYKKILGEN